MNKRAFTLFEVVLAIIIFSTIIGVIFNFYVNIKKSENYIGNQQLVIENTNDFLDLLSDLSVDYTIDYEEYFNRSLAGCVSSGDSSWSKTGSCSIFSNYGNSGLNNGLYFCSSIGDGLSLSGYYYYDINNFNCSQSGLQSFLEYQYQFRDITDAYLNDGNDIFIGTGPIAISLNTGVQELYLISKNGDHRIFFRKKFITGADINGDGSITGENESLYSIQMLKLKGFDAGFSHDFSSSESSNHDGFVDTWACDTQAGFVCSGASIGNGEFSGYKLPVDIDDGRQDITDKNITITDRNFEIYPSKDPYLATNEKEYSIDPFVKISIKSNIYGKLTNEDLVLQTSIGFKNSYFNSKGNIYNNQGGFSGIITDLE